MDHVTVDRCHDCVEHEKKLEKKFRLNDIDESSVGPVVIALDASDTEEEPEDNEADDENENGDIFGVQPLE